jgi:hypothetical protein
MQTKNFDQKENGLTGGVYAVTFTAALTTNQHFLPYHKSKINRWNAIT